MIGLIAPLTLLSLINGNRVDASVNMRSASFQKTWSDNGLISRTYNSRSMYQGLFGFGWCSNLELRITRESPVKILLEKCGEPIIFIKKKKSRTYIAENVNERLTDEPHNFIYISPEGAKHFFDKRGRLIRIEDGVRLVNVEYDVHSKISSLKTNTERLWNVTYDALSKHITGFKTPSGHSWSYLYKDENLISVNENGAALSKFDYDEVHNMLRSSETSTEVEVITYDLEKDLVLEYRRSNGCIEKFTYISRPLQTGSKETAIADIKCGFKSTRIIHEFWYLKKAGAYLLTKFRSIVNERAKETRFVTSVKGG